eukprot:g3299.t1
MLSRRIHSLRTLSRNTRLSGSRLLQTKNEQFSKFFHSSSTVNLSSGTPEETNNGVSPPGDYGMRFRVPFVDNLSDSTRAEDDIEVIPAFQILAPHSAGSNFVSEEAKTTYHDRILNEIGRDECLHWYRCMKRLNAIDSIFYDAQRQGRISFYMTSSGEEGAHVGSAAALSNEDMIYAQYRETGVLLYRGFTLQQVADQCFSNEGDPAKGRQMPVHYGSRELNFQTISSPLATQIPQASGAAYAFKVAEEDRIVACYFGEGAASEGDFHPAMNFASTLDCPVVFFCRNNGFAISTPVEDQFRGDGIASRAAGYGMTAIRVDGNDAFAVYFATQEARRIAKEESRPVMVEAMTYRQGHHSTSDDSTRYREVDDILSWKDRDDPVKRFRLFLESEGWWDEERENSLNDTERTKVLEALVTAEKKPAPQREHLFTDVYDDILPHLEKQRNDLEEHLAKYPNEYR